jgi:hypothetical protein
MAYARTSNADLPPAPLPDPTASRLLCADAWTERELVSMLTAYRPVGGVVSGDDLAAILRDHHPQPISVVARWVVRRAILSFSWRGQTLIPLFQFERSSMCPRNDVLAVIRELQDAFDDWEVALWFTTPNTWLEDRARPVNLVGSDPQAVLRAAQADRYIVTG